MRLTRTVAVAGLAALSMTALSCKKSSTAPDISLSQAEVGTLFTELSTVLSSIGGVTFSGWAGASGSPLLSVVPGPNFSAMGPISGSANCPSGGTVSVSGSESSTTTSETFDITATFSSCHTTSFTVGGSFRETGNFNFTQTTISGSATVTGNLSVTASGGRSGNCGINFTVTLSGSSTSPTASASGTICGVNASGTVT